VADEKPIVLFADAEAFRVWLAANHAHHPGVWVKIAKKASPTPSVSYDEALDVAISYGWIDGQKKPIDDHFWMQAFTARRPRSAWSKRNVDKATAMIESGRMQPAGLAQVEAAKADGRWESAYAGPAGATESAEFRAALDANPAASEFYATLNSANRFAFYYRIHSAKKEETRARRIEAFVAMLARGEKFH
jgi:uncharacterized protein YdeI (YjbR/CyaY-like superfamily)